MLRSFSVGDGLILLNAVEMSQRWRSNWDEDYRSRRSYSPVRRDADIASCCSRADSCVALGETCAEDAFRDLQRSAGTGDASCTVLGQLPGSSMGSAPAAGGAEESSMHHRCTIPPGLCTVTRDAVTSRLCHWVAARRYKGHEGDNDAEYFCSATVDPTNNSSAWFDLKTAQLRFMNWHERMTQFENNLRDQRVANMEI